ncbi:MAG: hypothetical protein KA116_02395 [Proteobacteria bacterium]|nr:hypothetical protein [Pseudomonadota bacterium]
MRNRKLFLIKEEQKWTKDGFGGSLLNGNNAKVARPFHSKYAQHVVLRSTLAKGKYSLLLKSKIIDSEIRKQANRFFVNIYQIANAGNHIHLVLRAHNRREFRKFLRIISSLIARKVLGAHRNSAVLKDSKRRFWDARPWSRIISWGRHFKNAVDYLKLNRIEVNLKISRVSAREIYERIKFIENNTKLSSTGFS